MNQSGCENQSATVRLAMNWVLIAASIVVPTNFARRDGVVLSTQYAICGSLLHHEETSPVTRHSVIFGIGHFYYGQT